MNVYLPAESVVEEPRHRFLDWRFLAALAVLVLLAFLVYAGVRNYNIREAEAAQKDALIEQLADRSQQIETLERDVARLVAGAREDRKRAARERATLIGQQRRMIRLLQRYGIAPPAVDEAGIFLPDDGRRSEPATTTPAREDSSAKRPTATRDDEPSGSDGPPPAAPLPPSGEPEEPGGEEPEPTLLEWLLPDPLLPFL